MTQFVERDAHNVARRSFLSQVAGFAGYCVLSCELEAQQPNTAPGVPVVNALDDKDVIHGRVDFKSGTKDFDAYLARPNKKGRFPIVTVVAGNPPYEDYVRNFTAMFAQIGFIGIAPNIYSLQKDWMSLEQKRKVLAEGITDTKIFKDVEESILYARRQGFGRSGRIGITGFCFGGRCALMYAASHPNEVAAVVPFYGNLKTPLFAGRTQDPIDVARKIKVPVQGHYSENDPEIPLVQLKAFETSLKKNGKESEIFTYAAAHGFFTHERTTYDPNAAKLSWQRTAAFFKKYLGH